MCFVLIVVLDIRNYRQLWVLNLVSLRDVRYAYFVAGVACMMNVLLLETAVLWSDFSNGIQIGICTVEGSKADSFVSIVATFLFISNLVLSALTALWRDALLEEIPISTNFSYNDGNTSASYRNNAPGDVHHAGVAVNSGSYQRFGAANIEHDSENSPGSVDMSHFVIDDKGDSEL